MGEIDKLKLELNKIIEKIDKPFINERHFQTELYLELNKISGELIEGIILEYPFFENKNEKKRNRFLDILIKLKNKKYVGIELKYKTKEENVEWHNKKIKLKNQEAHDLSRYDFLKDIDRLEKLKDDEKIEYGFAIIVSNDARIWSPASKRSVSDFHIRFTDKENILIKKVGPLGPEIDFSGKSLREYHERNRLSISNSYFIEKQTSLKNKNIFYSIIEVK